MGGGKPRRLTFDPAFDHGPRYSRDGKSIYFNSQWSGEYHVWKMPVAGGDAVPVTHRQDSFATAGETRIQFFDLSTRTSTTVARGMGSEWTEILTVAPHGRTFLFARVDSTISDLMLVENFR